MKVRNLLAAIAAIITVHIGSLDAGDIPAKYKGFILYAPDPDYPMDLVRRGVKGSGLFRATINPSTGKVTEVKVLKGTPYVILNELAAKALFQWRFKPGATTGVDVPFSFEVSGYSRVLH